MKISFKTAHYLVLTVTVVFLAYIVAIFHLESRRSVTVPVLMYHKIGTAGTDKWWVQPGEFERQLSFLRDTGYSTVLPADLLAHRRWGKPLPRKPLILTFDDGYLCTLTTVEPMLKKYGFKGIVYLITDLVGDSVADRRDLRDAACLVWPEVREMHARGVLTFGGHSVTHRNLAIIPDSAEEIKGCYEDIVDKGGFAPDSFCYPYGQYRPETLDIMRRSKWSTAMTCVDEPAVIGPDACFLELPRVSVIGGIQDYKITVTGISGAGVTARVSNAGTPIRVTPALVPEDAGLDPLWLDPFELTSEPVELNWTTDVSRMGAGMKIELWDSNKILQLYKHRILISEL